MNEKIPTATELREKHAEHAATVKFLGDLAANQGESVYVNEDERVEHRLVPGYRTGLDGEYSTSAPVGAQSHLEQAKESAQRELNEKDQETNAIVTENLDTYKSQAQAEMDKEMGQRNDRLLNDAQIAAKADEMIKLGRNDEGVIADLAERPEHFRGYYPGFSDADMKRLAEILEQRNAESQAVK